jgi:hypothetical protein
MNVDQSSLPSLRSAWPTKWQAAFATAVCLVTLAGCHKDPSASAEHDQEHEHAGHFIPAHKPKSFPQAIRRLRELNQLLSRKLTEGKSRDLIHDDTLAVAIDIATWLPEIAADSDMPEQSWNRANDRSAVIVSNYQKLASNPASDSTVALKKADEAISELETLLADSDARWFGNVVAGGK